MTFPERWSRKNVLIVARTYPRPSKKSIEVSCTAGITEDGHWIRLFPIPYRFLDPDKRFTKYQTIEVYAMKAPADSRPESYKVDTDKIKVIAPEIPSTNAWLLRKARIFPLKASSLCALQQQRNLTREPTLGFIKAHIKKLAIKPTSSEWTADELRKLHHSLPLFGTVPQHELIKLPYDFSYEFKCDQPDCPSHNLICTDWEIGASFLRWKSGYGLNWEEKFRETYEAEMITAKDTHFFVGNLHEFPNAWIIIGLFYPPKLSENATQPSLL